MPIVPGTVLLNITYTVPSKKATLYVFSSMRLLVIFKTNIGIYAALYHYTLTIIIK